MQLRSWGGGGKFHKGWLVTMLRRVQCHCILRALNSISSVGEHYSNFITVACAACQCWQGSGCPIGPVSCNHITKLAPTAPPPPTPLMWVGTGMWTWAALGRWMSMEDGGVFSTDTCDDVR